MTYFRRIIQYAKPYKRFAVLNIVCNIFYAIFSTLSLLALIPVIRILFDEEERVAVAPNWEGWTGILDYAIDAFNYEITQRINEDEVTALIFVCGIVVLLFFLKNLFGYLAAFFLTFLRNGVLRDVRDAIYDKILTLPVSYFSEKRKGDTISRITADVNEVQTSFLSILELIVKEPLVLIFTIIAMLAISPKLTLFVFVFLPISGFIISVIGKKLKSQSNMAQEETGYFLSLVEETLSSLKIVKGFNAEDKFREKFKSSTNRLKTILDSLLNRQNLASPTSEFLGIFVIVIILWFGGNMVLVEGSLDGAQFIAFMGLAYNILTPAKQISKATYSVQKGNAAAERIFQVLDTTPSIVDVTNAIVKNDFQESITVENISFRYEDEYVLKNFSVTVKKGETVALVGQSGSGKSTIANLITRFYDVDEGEIKVDAVNIKK